MLRIIGGALVAAVLASGTHVFAQTAAQELFSGTPEEQAACRRDVRQFCRHIKAGAGNNAFLQCLQEHRTKLSEACGRVLKSHGV